jgi:hypothetical protein
MDKFTEEEKEYIKYAFKPDHLYDDEEPRIPTPYDPTGKVSLTKFQENILEGEIKELQKKRKQTTSAPRPKRSRTPTINVSENVENTEIDNLLDLDENDFNGGKKYKSKKYKRTKKYKKSKKSKKSTRRKRNTKK